MLSALHRMPLKVLLRLIKIRVCFLGFRVWGLSWVMEAGTQLRLWGLKLGLRFSAWHSGRPYGPYDQILQHPANPRKLNPTRPLILYLQPPKYNIGKIMAQNLWKGYYFTHFGGRGRPGTSKPSTLSPHRLKRETLWPPVAL